MCAWDADIRKLVSGVPHEVRRRPGKIGSFDLIELDGKDLCREPLEQRKDALADVLRRTRDEKKSKTICHGTGTYSSTKQEASRRTAESNGP
jgi:ATP-dependent DNA ligase